MKELSVRFKKIAIRNWKNVKNGEIIFNDEKNRLVYHPSIVGLYGQNGSGKTTLIQVIDVVKTLLMGQSLPDSITDLISNNEDTSSIFMELSLSDYKSHEYRVEYFVELNIIKEFAENVINENAMEKKKIVVNNEKLSFSHYVNNELVTRKNDLIISNYNNSIPFLPESKLKILSNNSKEAQYDLKVSKTLSYETSKSFIFNANTLKVFREQCKEETYLTILNSIVNYANFNLFVIDTNDIGLINANLALPFNFKIKDDLRHVALGRIALNIKGISLIPEKVLHVVEMTMDNMNLVLSQIIPNLNVKIEKKGIQILEDGTEMVQVQLYSLRNGVKISLENESEGIKKLVSILQILIVMYNNPSTTVAIDELDSGIFEYLLGELLKIISQSAKGQLIFSSHNLRPLETIDKKYVYFTTTNENNRYVKMSNVLKNNNLRDFYFRELLLGGQKEELYEQTNNGAIALAFSEAGDISE